MGRPREHNEETRRRLLGAAERVIAEDGPDALSVRGVADRAGTTTRAVYSLFGSKEGLVAALAEAAYEWIYDAVDEVPETEDSGADLVAIGLEVFRRFVRDHPALYRITYQRVIGLTPQPRLVTARQRAFIQLQGRLQRLKDAEGLPRKRVIDATAELIAMFEGLANAELRGHVLPTISPGDEERAWREGVATLLRGMTAPPDGGSEQADGVPRSARRPEDFKDRGSPRKSP
jgi:AcrR family transcriptional regulator